MSGSNLSPDLLAVVEATDNAQATARTKGETWSRLTPVEQATRVLREMNRLGWFVVERETVDAARQWRRKTDSDEDPKAAYS